ncbi:TrkH family potassium uptake protein [Dickeya sp. ws52]|uniref:TrkH family potassium uptake protein n=1 Tax=Dickeya sp. ws52 TaxID=2576377 RepID=UPI00117DED82|nr:TrkH family potassium uptake protein [Dickeya sp. ws52]TYL42950.1 potassium transporter TrkG [Dickeya sp. ws52]
MITRNQLMVITRLCSFLIMLYSLSMLPPSLVALWFREKSFFAFLYTFLLVFPVGVAGWMSTRQQFSRVFPREGFLIIVIFWLLFSLISALPLTISSDLNISFTDAMFEGVSGITTTGGSVLSNIDNLPKSILFYRSQLNFIGGLGVIVVAVALLPMLGIGGARLYQSETPGPFKEEKLTPRLADTSRQLWGVYSLLAIACAVAYWLAGMPWFDAVCHALSTVSLGGFSSKTDSLGYYANTNIEMVGGVFSLLAGVNFILYYVALHRRSLKPLMYNPELRFYLLIFGLVAAVVCGELYRLNVFDAQGAFVHGFFMTASIMTDNGLATSGYAKWPEHVVIFLMASSFFGGCIGSTCGGIKALRLLILYKQSKRELEQLVRPNAICMVKINDVTLQENVIRSVWSFFFLYIFFSCVFIFSLNQMGYDLVTSFSTVAACINNMGLGLGATADGFGGLSNGAKWLMCLAMVMGRLEIYPILVLFSSSFWRS